jgi:hypothetical protein
LKKTLVTIAFTLLLTACSSLKVAKIDPNTGYFPSKNFATVVKSEKVDLDAMKAMILVPDADFEKGQIKNIGFFDEVITFSDLEKLIISNELTDKVPTVRDRIGLNKAAKAYKNFLWFRYDTRRDGNKQYAQYILTDPLTLEDIFITEQYLDYVWAGVNDQNTWYPMYNSLVKYLKENSTSFN